MCSLKNANDNGKVSTSGADTDSRESNIKRSELRCRKVEKMRNKIRKFLDNLTDMGKQ